MVGEEPGRADERQGDEREEGDGCPSEVRAHALLAPHQPHDEVEGTEQQGVVEGRDEQVVDVDAPAREGEGGRTDRQLGKDVDLGREVPVEHSTGRDILQQLEEHAVVTRPELPVGRPVGLALTARPHDEHEGREQPGTRDRRGDSDPPSHA